MKRILAFDVGEKRIGVAVSDALGITAQAVETYTRTGNPDADRTDPLGGGPCLHHFGTALGGGKGSRRTSLFTGHLRHSRHEPGFLPMVSNLPS